VKTTMLELMQKYGKQWEQNEQKKQAAKDKVIKTKLYPNDRDIYGKKAGDER
jgi:hypothetical protein